MLGKKEKGASEDEMGGWHHRCSEYELGQTLGDGEGHGGLVLVGVFDDVMDGLEFFDILVGDFDIKFFFESRDQVDEIERIDFEVLDKASLGLDVFFFEFERFCDEFDDFFIDVHF